MSFKIHVDQIPGAPKAFLLTRTTAGAAGFDICAAEDVSLANRGPVTVRTGLRFTIPAGYEAQIRSRSGLAAKEGIFVLNAPGTIDSDYQGEILIILARHAPEGAAPFEIKSGMRIAQVVFAPVAPVVVEGLANDEALAVRGEGGLGSTGL